MLQGIYITRTKHDKANLQKRKYTWISVQSPESPQPSWDCFAVSVINLQLQEEIFIRKHDPIENPRPHLFQAHYQIITKTTGASKIKPNEICNKIQKLKGAIIIDGYYLSIRE